MSTGIIDVRDWQVTVDFQTGNKIELENELTGMVREIIQNNRYPGDMDLRGIDWVTDMGLRLADKYNPDFMFLSYAQPYFFSAYGQGTPGEWESVMKRIFDNVEKFLAGTDFWPVVVGLGRMTDLLGKIDLSILDCLAIATNWSLQYAGLFNPTAEDIEKVKAMPKIEKVISKEDFVKEYGGSESFIKRFPDYLLTAEEGYTFKGFESTSRKIKKIPAKNTEIPVYTTLGEVNSLIDIRGLIDSVLPEKKVALIVIEAIGAEDFEYEYKLCSNKLNSYIYEHIESQYLAMTTGKHFQYHPFPPVFKFFEEDHENKSYPFSGSHYTLPQDTIGRRKDIKSGGIMR